MNGEESAIPTISQALIFRGKAALLQSRRAIENLLDFDLKRFSPRVESSNQPIVAESKTPLWTDDGAAAERFLLAGKVHNLRLAINKINNLEIPASAVFSFWKHVGRATRRRGFVAGRELREGCVVPAIGGGLCQLSNALYDAALLANFEIVERRAHTRIVSGSLAERGRDATVFWNYVDLRFRSPRAFRIEAKLGKEHLTVRFRSDAKRQNFVSLKRERNAIAPAASPPRATKPNSCATCGVESCFRSLKPKANLDFGRAAFLLDEFSPEFDRYVQTAKSEKDFLFVPLDGARFGRANYAWTRGGFAQTKQSFFVALLRSYKSRRLAAQGAARQTNLLAASEKLAASCAKNLPFDATHLVVQQNLLPFLWRAGILGGRTFDVLMTALPLKDLQQQLNFAASLHPQSKTLADFRAGDSLVEDETEALQNARKIITAHTAIAALFPERVELLEWKISPREKIAKKRSEKYTIVFPASTVGRKGCYELRAAIENLDVKILTLGANFEGENFWENFDVEKANSDWLALADLVVLPAFIEHRPRCLLDAAARGVAVVASKNCGVEAVAGIKTIEAGDADALRNEIKSSLAAFQT